MYIVLEEGVIKVETKMIFVKYYLKIKILDKLLKQEVLEKECVYINLFM